MNDDYDTPWKDALTPYFAEFAAFYFPAAHGQIDWTAPCDFLEQELAQVARDAELGCRRVDKLVRVSRIDGGGCRNCCANPTSLLWSPQPIF